MQWQERNFEKWCKWEDSACPLADDKVDVVTNIVE
jgi:hypothetical protein